MDTLAPDFGVDIARASRACTPRELYRALLDAEDNVHYFEPAFRLATTLLSSDEQPDPALGADGAQVLIDAALADLPALQEFGYASSWPVRVVREFAPAGIVDGVWLQGLIGLGQVENEVGMAALRQLMARYGDPGTADGAAQRYESLLRSVGVAPASISRYELDELSPCCDLAYEHALLGMALALFPTALRAETVGFNLWMAAIGPCPLLHQLTETLRSRGADLSYLDTYDRPKTTQLAVQTMTHLLAGTSDDSLRRRVVRGFLAAHRSYRRWHEAVCGANVPMRPVDCVIDIVRRKARFAIGHHGGVLLNGCSLEEYFSGDRAAHEQLVAHLAESAWVRPGVPEQSQLVTDVLSMDGPMFDIFTASEQQDLREWIAGLGHEDEYRRRVPLPLAGLYAPPQDAEDLRRYAMQRFRSMSFKELMFHLVNADQCPPVRLFARSFVSQLLAKVRAAFDDPRLNATDAPRYSEQAVAHMVLENHARNVSAQRPVAEPGPPRALIGNLIDGCWLQGFADVRQIGWEEYGWLFRIYASEMGDGSLNWNHNYIARKMLEGVEPRVTLPATDRGLYEAVDVGVVSVAYMAMALNTRHFLPELLGINLGIEARGVCGGSLSSWKAHERLGDHWSALYHRLHNSIDNYASGHTKWSLAAVQAFMARVENAVPASVEDQWRRIWQLWRLLEIQAHGSDDEAEALKQNLGAMATESLVPSSF